MEKPRYIVEYARDVEKDLRKIPKTIRDRIRKAIEEKLIFNPRDYGENLTGDWKGFRRIRIGDYRVIYDIIDDKLIIFVIKIDHRKDIYR